MADVVANNVVGYNRVQLNAGGKNMIGSCFINVGSEKTMNLTDLKIIGYEESAEYLMNYMEFTATFQRRATDGMPYATYAYTDTTDDLETWNGGKWYDFDTGAEITADNDVTLKAGDGLWFDTPALLDCTGFYLQSSGEVLKGSCAFELNAGGKIGVCNMMPTSTTLTKLEIHGYEDSAEYLMNYMEFTLTMQSLATDGMPLATYAYTDTTDDLETWNGGKWFDFDTGSEISSDEDITIGAGEGFWVDTPALLDCELFTMVFPACL